MPVPEYFRISSEVRRALASGKPVVALESTVITHGLPYPDNLALAGEMEHIVCQEQAIPATVGVLDGILHIGLLPEQLERLARADGMVKVSTRDFAPVIAKKLSGGTTVAATLFAAHKAGIRVFATGGIGGVHRNAPFDISADLTQLAKTPMILVCAGAKAILDLPGTLEYLETMAVPVVGYRTSEFPAFYSRSSGLKLSVRADTPAEAAALALANWAIGLSSSILVANPPPEEDALPWEYIRERIDQALMEAEAQGMRGQDVTPFLLKKVTELTGGASLIANLGLLKNNARLAAQIARALTEGLG